MNIEIVPPGCPVTFEVGRESIHGPLLVLIDAEDYPRLAGSHWGLDKRPAWRDSDGNEHAETFLALKQTMSPRTKTWLHRVIMNAKDDELVKHKNGNGLDCRKANLLVVKKG